MLPLVGVGAAVLIQPFEKFHCCFCQRDYDSEIFAFGNRVGALGTPSEAIVRALTDQSFFTRADVVENSALAQPSKEEEIASREHNNSLISAGNDILTYVVFGYLRHAMPSAPEEFIEAQANQIACEEMLAKIASHLGFAQLVRTAEFPPSRSSLVNSLKALLATMTRERAEALIINVVISQLLDVDLIESFPLTDPLAVVTDLLHGEGYKVVEPRIMHSAGEMSAEPIYLVGIYADEKLFGESPGETVPVAVDMAARDALLKLWRITPEYLFPFGSRAHSIDFAEHQTPNYSLREKCQEKTDLSLSAAGGEDPLDVTNVAQRYWNEVQPVAGNPLKRRLRHKFSRGSLAKRSFRYLVKPRPHTVC